MQNCSDLVCENSPWKLGIIEATVILCNNLVRSDLWNVNNNKNNSWKLQACWEICLEFSTLWRHIFFKLWSIFLHLLAMTSKLWFQSHVSQLTFFQTIHQYKRSKRADFEQQIAWFELPIVPKKFNETDFKNAILYYSLLACKIFVAIYQRCM